MQIAPLCASVDGHRGPASAVPKADTCAPAADGRQSLGVIGSPVWCTPDLADSVQSGPGPLSFGVVWPRAGKRPRAIIEPARHWQAGG